MDDATDTTGATAAAAGTTRAQAGTGQTGKARPRSVAWPLGLLAISGPVAMFVVLVVTVARMQVSGVPFVVAAVWCVVSLLLGGAAIVVAVEDRKAPQGTGPRLADAGMALGTVAAALVGVGILVVLLAWASLSV